MSNGFKVVIDPTELDYRFIASEIVRGMTNSRLSSDQKKALQSVAQGVMVNQLVYKKPKLEGESHE